MLSICAGLSPNDGTGLIAHRITISVNRFAVAFHIALLKVSSKAVHVLIIWQYSLRRGSKKIIIPNADQRKDHGNIFFELFFSEMLVHGMSAVKKFFEIFETDRTRY